MQRMQILFSKPQLSRLRKIAQLQDRPVSELIRGAVDFWLSRYSLDNQNYITEQPPVYSCGDIAVPGDELRTIAHEDREHV
jgi:hypothetical protein